MSFHILKFQHFEEKKLLSMIGKILEYATKQKEPRNSIIVKEYVLK